MSNIFLLSKYMSPDIKTRASFFAALQEVITEHSGIELKEMVSLHMSIHKEIF